MNGLAGRVAAPSGQRSPTRRAAAWLLAIAGPALLTLSAMPSHSSLSLGGFLFCALLVVIIAAIIGGTRPALSAIALSAAARELFFAPPFAHPGTDLRPNVLALAGFTVAGAAVAIIVGELIQLAGEQASSRRVESALRRVATLVARAAPPEELFGAVTEEAGKLLDGDFARLGRYESGDALTFLAAWSRSGDHFPVGSRWTLAGDNVSALVLQTGRPARIDNLAEASGPLAVISHERGGRSVAGAPIIVDGRIWGVMAAGSTMKQRLPTDTEARLASITDLLATAIGNAESRAGIARLGQEQAALRRLATLVARGARPEDVFAAVTNEAGKLLPVNVMGMGRYGSDGTTATITGWSPSGPGFPVGTRLDLGGKNLATLVAQTSRPARIENYAGATGHSAQLARESGFRCSVGTPILVDGRLWGFMIGGSIRDPLPPDTEARLASFTELVATSIANAESHAALTRLAEEQAALRRVATLVARGAPPGELFAAVTKEAGQLLGADKTTMSRYEPDGTVSIVAGWSAHGDAIPVGERPRLGGHNLVTIVSQTSRPARIQNLAKATGSPAGVVAALGVTSGVGAPVIVQDRLWGILITNSASEQPLPPDTEARLASFTELVGTAIANAESLCALDASRARIVAASDEARRRIERDLHDGAQQRLISLGLSLRAAQTTIPPRLGALQVELAKVADGLAGVMDELREMAHGIHPVILARGGLGPALKTLARRSPVPVELDVQHQERLPERIEVAAYYVVSEALTNAAKHARASVVQVDLKAVDGAVRLGVRDDGAGGADPGRGSGLVGLKDRVETLGGTITVQSPAGGGTTLRVELPLNGAVYAGHSSESRGERGSGQ
ncbi:MAG TPA: GAF domain-containing protein [Streptosporangiaceae bacterium]|jgi:signal transduction histidine kinase|nr:GAF domain-containing protein [Streptosporangiaceae bacterium]